MDPMADETDDTIDERLASIQRRAQSFVDLLRDGDEVFITCDAGEVQVDESYRSKFERKHTKLFGRMLSVEAQLNTGWFPYLAALLLVGGFIFGLPLRWWDGILGAAVCEGLQSWIFYLSAPVVILYLAHLGCKQWQKFVYRKHRQELADLIAAEQLDRDVLLVMLRDEEELETVIHQMKLDAVK